MWMERDVYKSLINFKLEISKILGGGPPRTGEILSIPHRSHKFGLAVDPPLDIPIHEPVQNRRHLLKVLVHIPFFGLFFEISTIRTGKRASFATTAKSTLHTLLVP